MEKKSSFCKKNRKILTFQGICCKTNKKCWWNFEYVEMVLRNSWAEKCNFL